MPMGEVSPAFDGEFTISYFFQDEPLVLSWKTVVFINGSQCFPGVRGL